jgi:hypothetical protein
MIRIQFTAKRALAGHAAGATVTLTFSAAELTPGRKLVRDVQKSLSGKRETLLHNALRTWNITTEPLEGSKLDALEEFLTAVEDGSAFDFEPWWMYGADPSDIDQDENRLRASPTVRAVLGSEQYDISRLVGYGNGGQDDPYQVTFTVEEVPA